MRKVWNRPLSPHLTIYSGQFTSIYSIWHRITGVLLVFLLTAFLFLCKIFSYSIFSFYSTSFFLELSLWVKNCVFLNILLMFIYHLFNGLRHISWDLGFNLQSINDSTKVYVLIILIFIILLLLKSITS